MSGPSIRRTWTSIFVAYVTGVYSRTTFILHRLAGIWRLVSTSIRFREKRISCPDTSSKVIARSTRGGSRALDMYIGYSYNGPCTYRYTQTYNFGVELDISVGHDVSTWKTLTVATEALAQWQFTEVIGTSTSVSTRIGDHQGRPGAVNLCSFVGVNLPDRLYNRFRAATYQTKSIMASFKRNHRGF